MNVGEGACRCYWLEPTGTYKLGLRRFTFSNGGECADTNQGHDASVITEQIFTTERTQDEHGKTLGAVPASYEPEHYAPPWPAVCDACGGEFPEDAEWQMFHAEGYVRSDTGETIWTRHVHGTEFAGALFDGWWHREQEAAWGKKLTGADGVALVAVCPDGHQWHVDGEATGGGHWTRNGDPRNPETLTCSPSILIGGSYHGFLQNGHFTAHIG